MERYLGNYSAYVYAVLRIIAGLMFAMHGTQKLFGWPAAGPPGPLPPMVLAAGVIELVCGVLIAIGLLTGFAAFVASGQMAFAYFIGHAGNGFYPLVNKGELAVLYCFLFLYMATRGAVIWGLDTVMKRGVTRPGIAT